MAGAVSVNGAVSEADLDLALNRYNVLTPWRCVPVGETPQLGHAKYYACCRVQCREFRVVGRVQVFYVSLSIVARVDS